MVKISDILMILLSFVIGCGDKIGPGNTDSGKSATVKAKTAIAQISNQPYSYEAVGTVQAKIESTLAGKLMAIVKSIKVKEGDKVSKGDLLVVLDPVQADVGLNQANAALEEAKRAQSAAVSGRDAAAAEADLAKSTYQRYQQLIKENSVSRQEFEEVKAKYQASQAALSSSKEMLKAAAQKVEQAKAGLDGAKASKTDTEIRAPYNGIITSKRMEEGSMAAPGAPILSVEGGEGFRADITVPETYLSSISIGQILRVSITNAQDAPIDGVVQTIMPIADAASRSFLVKISLPDTVKVHSGMFARVSIPVGHVGGNNYSPLLIPKSAVIHQGQLTGVFKVDESRKARFRLIRTGRELGDAVEILSGLKNGEKFVLSPVTGITDGATVEDAS